MSYGIRQETGRPVKIKDEGLTLVSNVKSVDFTGDGVAGSAIGSDVTEEITGGGGGGGGAWGTITGTLSDQTDLQDVLDELQVNIDGKQDAGSYLTSSSISDTAYGIGWDGDTTHAASKNAIYDAIEGLSSVYAPVLGADDNYVTDAEKTVIGNTSGANTGDQSVPVKATGAEINTGTDDAKFVTPKALEDQTTFAKLVSPSFTTPALGTPTAGTLTNCSFPTLNQNTTGTAANLSGTPALPNGTTATTQAAADNSTKLATTAYADTAAAGGGATAALDNLASVQINTTLVSDADIQDDLGTGDVRWKDAWFQTLSAGLTAADTLKLRGRDVDGSTYIDILTITSNNTVTADLNALVTIGGNAILDDTSASSALTSVGTLTSLQVDNININLNTISSTAGTDLLITPLANQQIVLDNTIIIDAGVVTGATSITSTAFVGDITGDVTGNADTVTNATFTTALTVDTGTLTLTAAGANNSVLTIGAGASSVSGANTGDQDLSGKADVGQTMHIGTTSVAINRASAALTLAGITLTAPDIGTPSAGVLTNCSFPTLNQNTTGSAATLTTGRTIGGVSFNGSANIVPNTITIADESADTTCFVGFFTAATGGLQPKTAAGLTFNASTDVLSATGFAGPLTGNVTGDCSGSSGTCTGEAATVATINGLAPDTATTQATQASITTCAALTTVSALDSGSITANFGTINNGASAITTTGDITGGGIHITGDTAAGDNAALGYTAAEGLIMTGQGSTNDLTFKNDADAEVMKVLTGTTTLTMAGAIQLGETSIKLDATLSADAKWSGITIAGTSGVTTLAIGDLIYLNANDSRWELVDANLSDGYDKQLGIALTAAGDGSALEVLVFGKVRSATFPAFTVGSPLYMSETAGDITHTQPTTTDVCIRIIGEAITAEDLFFNPDNTYITHT